MQLSWELVQLGTDIPVAPELEVGKIGHWYTRTPLKWKWVKLGTIYICAPLKWKWVILGTAIPELEVGELDTDILYPYPLNWKWVNLAEVHAHSHLVGSRSIAVGGDMVLNCNTCKIVCTGSLFDCASTIGIIRTVYYSSSLIESCLSK